MKKGSIHEVSIDRYAFGGKGIAEMTTEQGSFILFVPNAIPGQKVKIRIIKKKKRYAECQLLEVLEPSELQKEIPYQPISGAPYIQVDIEQQQKWKKDSTLEVFRRIAEIDGPEKYFDSFISSPHNFNYRNKMEYSFSAIGHDIASDQEFDGFALGFKRRGTWWKVENLDKESGLFDREVEDKMHLIREYCEKTGLPAWHPPQKKGFFRHLVVRKSFAEDRLLMHLITSSEGYENFDKKAFTIFMQDLFGQRLAGLHHVINDDVADRSKIENGTVTSLCGDDVIYEKILGLTFEISMESFFQTNPASAELLYQKGIEYFLENAESDGVLLDLFCGTGTIGQILASKLPQAQIIGVDIVEKAIEDAKENAKKNAVNNITFEALDVGKFLYEHPELVGEIKGIVLDPPRAGIAPKALKRVIELDAKNILYISCNPATQARDIKTLHENGYSLVKFSLVDQFPHTAHIESIALFELRMKNR